MCIPDRIPEPSTLLRAELLARTRPALELLGSLGRALAQRLALLRRQALPDRLPLLGCQATPDRGAFLGCQTLPQLLALVGRQVAPDIGSPFNRRQPLRRHRSG